MAEHKAITRLFADIQTWMRNHVSDVTFRPPASPAAIDHFVTVSGIEPPLFLRQLLLVADGETRASAGAIGNWRFLPITEIQAAWGLLTKLSEKGAFADLEPKSSPYIRSEWWHSGWIPFVSSDSGDYLCLDTDPIEPSRRGQVVIFLQNRPERVLVAGNLATWLERILTDLEAALYHYDPEAGFDGEAFMWSALEGKHLFENPGGKLIV